MKNIEERIQSMHRRAGELRQQREREILSGLFLFSVLLIGCIVKLSEGFAGSNLLIAAGSFAGSSLLNESFGGYIFTAILAFMAGVVITVICVKLRNRSAGSGTEKQNGKPKDDSRG